MHPPHFMSDENKTGDKANEVNEPANGYRAFAGKRIRVFKSFEEMEEAEAAEIAAQSPEQRIRETVQLILRVYGVSQAELSNRKRDTRIQIIHYE